MSGVPVLNVYENIVLPLQLDGRKPDQDYLHRIIETLGLEQKLHSLPNNLSGGQQQRVAIARALAAKPAILLADEPKPIFLRRKMVSASSFKLERTFPSTATCPEVGRSRPPSTILLADEPTGNLDSRTSQDVMSLLKVTGVRFAQTIVMITHNEEIAQMADRIVRIEDGRIAERRG